MNKIMLKLFLIMTILISLNNSAGAWNSYLQPNVIAGGSMGYFRISLDEFNKLYSSRWSPIYTGQCNVRFYRNYFVTVQYAKWINEKARENEDANNALSSEPRWEENFIHVGVRIYSESSGSWNFYYTLGLTFIKVSEKPGMSVFENNSADNKDGSGFFFELGSDVNLLPHLTLFLEFEITSAGVGGTPGFVGHSLGGYAFQSGLNFYF